MVRGRITVGLTAFGQQFRHLIQYVSAAPGGPTYLNLGGARSRGLEAALADAGVTGAAGDGSLDLAFDRGDGHRCRRIAGVSPKANGCCAGPSSSGGMLAEYQAGRNSALGGRHLGGIAR